MYRGDELVEFFSVDKTRNGELYTSLKDLSGDELKAALDANRDNPDLPAICFALVEDKADMLVAAKQEYLKSILEDDPQRHKYKGIPVGKVGITHKGSQLYDLDILLPHCESLPNPERMEAILFYLATSSMKGFPSDRVGRARISLFKKLREKGYSLTNAEMLLSFILLRARQDTSFLAHVLKASQERGEIHSLLYSLYTTFNGVAATASAGAGSGSASVLLPPGTFSSVLYSNPLPNDDASYQHVLSLLLNSASVPTSGKNTVTGVACNSDSESLFEELLCRNKVLDEAYSKRDTLEGVKLCADFLSSGKYAKIRHMISLLVDSGNELYSSTGVAPEKLREIFIKMIILGQTEFVKRALNNRFWGDIYDEVTADERDMYAEAYSLALSLGHTEISQMLSQVVTANKHKVHVVDETDLVELVKAGLPDHLLGKSEGEDEDEDEDRATYRALSLARQAALGRMTVERLSGFQLVDLPRSDASAGAGAGSAAQPVLPEVLRTYNYLISLRGLYGEYGPFPTLSVDVEDLSATNKALLAHAYLMHKLFSNTTAKKNKLLLGVKNIRNSSAFCEAMKGLEPMAKLGSEVQEFSRFQLACLAGNNKRFDKELQDISDATSIFDLAGNGPLMLAVASGDHKFLKHVMDALGEELVSKLIAKVNLFGETALGLAVRSGNLEMVKLLLNAGANPNLGSSCLLSIAVEQMKLLHTEHYKREDYMEIINLLLDNNANASRLATVNYALCFGEGAIFCNPDIYYKMVMAGALLPEKLLSFTMVTGLRAEPIDFNNDRARLLDRYKDYVRPLVKEHLLQNSDLGDAASLGILSDCEEEDEGEEDSLTDRLVDEILYAKDADGSPLINPYSMSLNGSEFPNPALLLFTLAKTPEKLEEVRELLIERIHAVVAEELALKLAPSSSLSCASSRSVSDDERDNDKHLDLTRKFLDNDPRDTILHALALKKNRSRALVERKRRVNKLREIRTGVTARPT